MKDVLECARKIKTENEMPKLFGRRAKPPPLYKGAGVLSAVLCLMSVVCFYFFSNSSIFCTKRSIVAFCFSIICCNICSSVAISFSSNILRSACLHGQQTSCFCLSKGSAISYYGLLQNRACLPNKNDTPIETKHQDFFLLDR